MARSGRFSALARISRMAKFCDRYQLSTRKGLERAAALEYRAERSKLTRREFLAAVGSTTAAAALGTIAGPFRAAARLAATPKVAIIGGGLAGLTCADRLRSYGIAATIFDANPSRLGGRCYSNRDFPGQVAENGGEFIDNLHKTLLSYANEFNLAREDLEKSPGDNAYYFFGQHYSEAEVVDEYRELVARMRPDLQAISGQPTFFTHTAADVALDRTDLATYLDTRGAGLPLIQAVLAEAYVAEYGREPWEQSCLNLLLFIHLDRRAKFAEFGVFSDERFHLVDGNDGIVRGIRERLRGPIVMDATLERLSRNAAGGLEMKLSNAARPVRADFVVLAIPFSVLRGVEIDPTLGLSPEKLRAIQELGYGYNAKTMIGFTGRPWYDPHRSNGLAYTDLPNVQNTWETNYSRAGATSILTDYSGGNRGYALQVLGPSGSNYCAKCHVGPVDNQVINDSLIQQQVEAFLTDLDRVWPGAKAVAARVDGNYLVHRAHWLPQRYSKGSYTCYLPGQFTTVAGLEGQSAGPLKFAGEHANSFYEWQGFMEGAALSGIATADEIIADIKAGRF